jgi:hypothetical protein
LSEIRNCLRDDIPAVAALFQRTFRNAGGKPPASLEAYLAEVHLDHPRYDPEVAARVHVDVEGHVTGFIGVFPATFERKGKTFRGAIAGSLMAENREVDPLAGAKLLRSVIKGPQDVTISETANVLSQALWERLGGKSLPFFSLDWMRVFRPAGAALSMLAEWRPRAGLLAPAARAADWLGRSWTRGDLAPAPQPARMTAEHDPSDADFAAAMLDLARDANLYPAWRESDLRWLLQHAAKKERYGVMRRTILWRANGDLAGCYLYHGDAGGIGRVLQVLARPWAFEDVVGCLFCEADQQRLAALRGRCTPQIFDALLKRQCIFAHRASTMFHTKDDDLAKALAEGDAIVTGLAGESWTRLIGGVFA